MKPVKSKPAKPTKSKYSTKVMWSLTESRDEVEDVSLDVTNAVAAIAQAVAQDYPYVVKTTVLFYRDTDCVEILEKQFILRPDLANVLHPAVVVNGANQTTAVIR